MFPYWMMFAIPACAVLSGVRLKAEQRMWPWLVASLVFIWLIGFRYQVGGDWNNYIPIFNAVGRLQFQNALVFTDPAYAALNWAVYHAGGSVIGVNFVCAIISVSGTVVFCRRQPNAWLAFLVAVPYLLIVIGMGYTRQSVAIGIAMVGLAELGAGRTLNFVISILIAATFHKTVVTLLPVAVLVTNGTHWIKGSALLATMVLAYSTFLANHMDSLMNNYVSGDMQSSGAGIRALMNGLPAIMFLLARRRLVSEKRERKLWIWLSCGTLLCAALIPISSTVADRLGLYLIPVQLYVFSRLPRLAKTSISRSLIILGIVLVYALTLVVWLQFASHASYWLPYQFAPLMQK